MPLAGIMQYPKLPSVMLQQQHEFANVIQQIVCAVELHDDDEVSRNCEKAIRMYAAAQEERAKAKRQRR